MSGPLDGVRVVDFTHVLSAPFCTSLLGDLGADVIKVEPPGGDMVREMGPPFLGKESAYFLAVNRNKRSIVLDLKHPDADEVAKRMVEGADVLVENFRPGVMDSLGLGYQQVSKINPAIVYGSLSAFGEAGSFRDQPGFELIIQALTGLVDANTPDGSEPTKVPIQVVDLSAGLFLTVAILGALVHRNRTGVGQRVTTSLLGSTLAMMTNLVGISLAGEPVPRNLESRNPQTFPSQVFRTADGHVAVVGHWERLVEALGSPKWVEPAMATTAYRVEHYQQMEDLVESVLRTRTTEEWVTILRKHDVAASPLNSVEAGLSHEAVQALDLFHSLEHPTEGRVSLLGTPWHMSVTPSSISPPPPLGLHSKEVLLELGFSPAEVLELEASGAVPTDDHQN